MPYYAISGHITGTATGKRNFACLFIIDQNYCQIYLFRVQGFSVLLRPVVTE